MVVVAVSAPDAHTAGVCIQSRWVASWAGVPTDASRGAELDDVYDASNEYKPKVDNSTVRAIITPTLGGSSVRVRLSNRFGTQPVTFSRTTIAKQGSGAAITGPAVPVTFGGAASATAPAGQDLLSDAVALTHAAFESLAVSTYVSENAGMPTEHYLARQTSYVTATGAGDHSGDAAGTAFSKATTTRPFVTGLDVMAPAAAVRPRRWRPRSPTATRRSSPRERPRQSGAGRQRPLDGRPRTAAPGGGIAAQRGQRRHRDGNRVLRDGTDPTIGRDTYGSSALNRLDADVLRQSGVHAVIILEGINDIAKDPTAADVIAGYQQLITRIHAAGVRVLLGTLLPTGGAAGGYGTAATAAKRDAINSWIRSGSSADGFVDFDAAVRDPSEPGPDQPELRRRRPPAPKPCRVPEDGRSGRPRGARRTDVHGHGHADGDGDGDGHGDGDGDGDRHGYSDRDGDRGTDCFASRHADGDGDGDRHGYSDRDGDRDTDCFANRHADGDGDGDRDTDRHADGDGDRHADATVTVPPLPPSLRCRSSVETRSGMRAWGASPGSGTRLRRPRRSSPRPCASAVPARRIEAPRGRRVTLRLRVLSGGRTVGGAHARVRRHDGDDRRPGTGAPPRPLPEERAAPARRAGRGHTDRPPSCRVHVQVHRR